MQKRERRRRGHGKTRTVRFVQAIRRQRCRRAPVRRRQRRAGAIDDRNWNKPCDVAPALPAIEQTKIIRSHQPDEMHAGTAPFQIGNRVERISGADRRLNRRDFDARMLTNPARLFDALCERRQFPRIFQRIARAHKPPDAMELETAQRQKARLSMSVVRRIETAAEQADTQARHERRRFGG